MSTDDGPSTSAGRHGGGGGAGQRAVDAKKREDMKRLMMKLKAKIDDGTATSAQEERYYAMLKKNKDDLLSDGEESDDPEDEESGNQLKCAIIVIVVLFVLGLLDSFTTKYAKRSSLAFAHWTIVNAPASFSLYCILIILLICCCLPYGPLSMLMGVVFTEVGAPTPPFSAPCRWCRTAVLLRRPSPACVCARHSPKPALRVGRKATHVATPISAAPSPRPVPSLRLTSRFPPRPQVYGFTNGIIIGVICLFLTTMAAAIICFLLARHKFREFVQKKVNRTKSLKILKNLDALIIDGQGFEMVLLVRLAPLPTGPSQYFLGTTSVNWHDFLAGNALTNSVFSFVDIMIGAGASTLSKDNPVGIFVFLTCVVGFFVLIGCVARRRLPRRRRL